MKVGFAYILVAGIISFREVLKRMVLMVKAMRAKKSQAKKRQARKPKSAKENKELLAEGVKLGEMFERRARSVLNLNKVRSIRFQVGEHIDAVRPRIKKLDRQRMEAVARAPSIPVN